MDLVDLCSGFAGFPENGYEMVRLHAPYLHLVLLLLLLLLLGFLNSDLILRVCFHINHNSQSQPYTGPYLLIKIASSNLNLGKKKL